MFYTKTVTYKANQYGVTCTFNGKSYIADVYLKEVNGQVYVDELLFYEVPENYDNKEVDGQLLDEVADYITINLDESKLYWEHFDTVIEKDEDRYYDYIRESWAS